MPAFCAAIVDAFGGGRVLLTAEVEGSGRRLLIQGGRKEKDDYVIGGCWPGRAPET